MSASARRRRSDRDPCHADARAAEHSAARRDQPAERGRARRTPGRRAGQAAQPGRRRLARPAPQPDLLDRAGRWSSLVVADGVVPGAVHLRPTRATARCPASTPGRPAAAIFGYDVQGCDVYARAVYGARASLLVGGARPADPGLHRAGWSGMLAGYFGGWVDAVLSRVIDIVLGIPLLLAAIVLLKRVERRQRDVRIVRGDPRARRCSAGRPRPGSSGPR